MHLNMNLKGLEEYVKKIEQVGNNADKAVETALDRGAEFLVEEMRAGVERHVDRGRALKAVKRTEVKREGMAASVDVGALEIRGADQDGFHVVYQEYGSPGRLKADPWLAPALAKTSKVKKIMTDALKEAGVPIE